MPLPFSLARNVGHAIIGVGFALILGSAWSRVDAGQAAPAASPPTEKYVAQGKRSLDKSSDIIVNGIPQGPFAVKVEAPMIFADRAQISKQAASEAQFFSRCVKPKDYKDLRHLIDGAPNGGVRISALDHIVRNHIACYPNFDPLALWSAGYYGDCNPRGEVEIIMNNRKQVIDGYVKRPICQAFFDRGAIVERVLNMYAPDLTFRTDELYAPEVMARLHAREDRFDKDRPQTERLYAKIVRCMVAFNPRLALAYPKAAVGSALETSLRNALIGTSPQCVGGVKQVSVDPSQFRVYVADAIYSWAVALKGTDSLIPNP